MLSGLTRYLQEHVFSHLGPIFSFLEPAVDALIRSGGTILADTALQVVTEIASDPSVVTNADKRNKAVQEIADRLKEKGIAAGENAINIALEGAVAKIKTLAPAQ